MVSAKDLYNIHLSRREAYLLFLASEETDTTLLPLPLTAQEESLYDACINGTASSASDAAEAAEAAQEAAEAAAQEAKDWATKTSAAVADGEYSAKYNAALAKDWANKTDGTVGGTDEYSAKYYAEQAAEAAGGGDVDPDSNAEGGDGEE